MSQYQFEIIKNLQHQMDAGLLTGKQFNNAVEKIEYSISFTKNSVVKEALSYLYSQLVIIKNYAPVIDSVVSRGLRAVGNASIILAPLDSDEIGSSRAVLYEIMNAIAQQDPRPKVTPIATLDAAVEYLEKDPKSVLILVDDFVGAGTQAETPLKTIDIKLRTRVWVWTLACSEIGLNNIESFDVRMITGIILSKASDLSKNPESLVAIVSDFSEQINLPKEYRLGRGKTEAMITLKNTPNNTYAFVWSKGIKMQWPAPFPRT